MPAPHIVHRRCAYCREPIPAAFTARGVYQTPLGAGCSVECFDGLNTEWRAPQRSRLALVPLGRPVSTFRRSGPCHCHDLKLHLPSCSLRIRPFPLSH